MMDDIEHDQNAKIVSEQMILAGLRSLADWSASDDWREENLVTQIYLAMTELDDQRQGQ